MTRIINTLLFLLFLVLTSRGVYVLAFAPAGGNRPDAAQNTAYILLATFAVLTLFFGFSLLRPKRSA